MRQARHDRKYLLQWIAVHEFALRFCPKAIGFRILKSMGSSNEQGIGAKTTRTAEAPYHPQASFGLRLQANAGNQGCLGDE